MVLKKRRYTFFLFYCFATVLFGDSKVERLISEIKSKRSQIRSLVASFEQRKKSPLFKEPQVAEGTLYFIQPDRVKIEYLEPVSVVVLISQRKMITYYKDLKRAEIIDVGASIDRILYYFSPASGIDTLKKYFSLKLFYPSNDSDPIVIDLTPVSIKLKKVLKRVVLSLDPKVYYFPVRIEIYNKNGSESLYTFEKVSINKEIDESVFKLELPEDVDLVKVSGVSLDYDDEL